MAVIPKESIFDSGQVKPSTFVVWCLLCQVKDKRQNDVYLPIETALKADVKKSAYYSAFTELEKQKWIKPSVSKNGQKRWFLVKGFSANVENETDSADVEFSANVEKVEVQNSANVESFSVNVESISANVETPPTPPYKDYLNRPNKQTKENQPKENLSPREPQKTKVNNSRYGIAVSEFDEGKQTFTDEIFDGLKSRLGTPAILPKEFEWLEAVNFAWSNKFPSTEFLKTYDLLERIRKLRRKEWRITAGMIESNIADTAKLELEINNLEKSNEQYKQSRTGSKQPENHTGNDGKYQQFGANPIIIA